MTALITMANCSQFFFFPLLAFLSIFVYLSWIEKRLHSGYVQFKISSETNYNILIWTGALNTTKKKKQENHKIFETNLFGQYGWFHFKINGFSFGNELFVFVCDSLKKLSLIQIIITNLNSTTSPLFNALHWDQCLGSGGKRNRKE